MKKHYWFVSLFFVWCLASGWWYLFGVKGVNIDPQLFSPEAATVSLIEILIMLLVAFLIGYVIAWSLRGETLENQKEAKSKLKREYSILFQSNNELKVQIGNWRNKLQRELALSQQKIQRAFSQRDKLQQQLRELEQAVNLSQQNLINAQKKFEQLDQESGTLRYRIRQLEFQNQEQEDAYAKLKREFDDLRLEKTKKQTFSDHPFVRLTELNKKDDLTKIKGIGPFIEKRLNMIGIYTFKQLSELTPEHVDRVGAAIEFFPHRIIKDNWVGQARNFARQ